MAQELPSWGKRGAVASHWMVEESVVLHFE
jgi:hypothetical protein